MAETLVVGVDGTADSLAALSSAAGLAEESGASLVVLHVRHDSGIAAGSLEAGAEAAMSDALDQAEKTSRERASDVLSGRTVHWRFDVSFGDPATELIAAARDHQASTIVVGGRSHGIIGGLVVGSVAQKLVRHSPLSVLVVRESPCSPPRGGLQRDQGAVTREITATAPSQRHKPGVADVARTPRAVPSSA
jgi:nucleotide-binding universal stress UspA family protein